MCKKHVCLLLFIIVLGSLSCHRQSVTTRNFPSQEMINESKVYYQILNSAVSIVLTKSLIDDHKKSIYLYEKAVIQDWNCFVYQRNNFFYHYSYVDTISEPNLSKLINLSTKGFRNLCMARHRSFNLDQNSNLYDFEVTFADGEPDKFVNYYNSDNKPVVVSPVIHKGNGDYEIYLVIPGLEGGVGYIVYFDYSDGEFLNYRYSMDAMDNFGCWTEEDYVLRFCDN